MKKLIPLSLIILLACHDEEIVTSSPEELRLRSEILANDNNLIISNAEELMDVTGNVLTGANILAHGRTFNTSNIALSHCEPSIDHFYLIDYSHYDTLLYIGRLTIDYGDGSKCTSDIARKGKVVDNFEYILNTKREIYSSRETLTFENYEKDSHRVEGSFIIESTTQDPVTLSTDYVKIGYPNGASIKLKGKLIFTSNQTSPGYPFVRTISGYVEGHTSKDQTFNAVITAPIEYNYQCNANDKFSVPVKGTVIIERVNGIPTRIDYGSGACDRNYSISYADKINPYEF